MNEEQFARKLRQVLERDRPLSEPVASRLRAARLQALARQRPEPEGVLAWADNVLGRLDGWGSLSVRVLLPLLVLVAGVLAIYAWESQQRIAETAELDAQLLADDLPIDAYLDRGFQNWLRSRDAEE